MQSFYQQDEASPEEKRGQQDSRRLRPVLQSPSHCLCQGAGAPGGERSGAGRKPLSPASRSSSQTRMQLIPETFLAQRRKASASYTVLLHPLSFQNFKLYNDMVPGRVLLTELEDISWAHPWQQEDHDVERLLTAWSRPSVIQLHVPFSRGERQVF